MSANYNGTAANTEGSLAGLLSIAGSTNANPIVVQTTASHGLTTGDTVDISSHVANVTANGVWPVTVTDGTHFSIPVAGVAVGGADGFVQPLSLGATAPIPSDGDLEAAVSVAVMLSREADQTAFLALATGQYKLVQRIVAGNHHGGASGTSWCQTNTTGSGYQNFQQSAVDIVWGVGGVEVGDIVEAELSCTVEIQYVTAATFNPVVSLSYGLSDWGVAPGSFAQIAEKTLSTPGGGNWFVPVTLKAIIGDAANGTGFANFGSGTNGLLSFKFMADVGGVTATLFGVGDYTMDIKVWRPTNMPQ